MRLRMPGPGEEGALDARLAGENVVPEVGSVALPSVLPERVGSGDMSRLQARMLWGHSLRPAT
eukprot:5423822-Prymnesium_polylepis.1